MSLQSINPSNAVATFVQSILTKLSEEKNSKHCHAGIDWIAPTEYSQMSTHLWRCVIQIIIGKLSHQQHTGLNVMMSVWKELHWVTWCVVYMIISKMKMFSTYSCIARSFKGQGITFMKKYMTMQENGRTFKDNPQNLFTYLRVRSMSYLKNTNKTGFRW